MKHTVSVEASKAAPPVLVSAGTSLGGIPLNEWVAIATITYILLQGTYLLWKWYREYKATKGG